MSRQKDMWQLLEAIPAESLVTMVKEAQSLEKAAGWLGVSRSTLRRYLEHIGAGTRVRTLRLPDPGRAAVVRYATDADLALAEMVARGIDITDREACWTWEVFDESNPRRWWTQRPTVTSVVSGRQRGVLRILWDHFGRPGLPGHDHDCECKRSNSCTHDQCCNPWHREPRRNEWEAKTARLLEMEIQRERVWEKHKRAETRVDASVSDVDVAIAQRLAAKVRAAQS